MVNKDSGSIADSKLVRLKQKDFLKCLNKRQIQNLREYQRPHNSGSYDIRKKDITIKHVSQQKNEAATGGLQVIEEQLRNQIFTYDDF